VGLLIVIGATGIFAATTVPSVPFSESFEGTHIYPFWSLTEDYGTVTLSKDHAYSGSQSLKFASTTGGQREMIATHKFAQRTKGSVSIAFFDAAPGQETLYEDVVLSDSANPANSTAVGTQDFDANCYMAYAGSGRFGPDANCGVYPQLETTPVKRTPGWHVFSIAYGASTVSVSIDGLVILTAPVNYEFDTIQLSVSGPYWRPNTLAYFDNFSFTPLSF
jgi:hypothetical protein